MFVALSCFTIDAVLTAFGNALRQRNRATDIVARFGGEEFVVLMPAADLEQAVAIAERIREALADGEQGQQLLRRLDSALYEAKRLGRNRVVRAVAGTG